MVPTTKPEGPVAEYFWPKVNKSPDGCWLWSGAKFASGYGKFNYRKRSYQAHRLAWMLSNGPIPSGLLVCHECDTPLCVRPDHLFLGTARDNTQDAISKGRMAIGEANANARTTTEQVQAIRAAYESAPMSPGGKRKRNGELARISREFGVPVSRINDIVHGRCWTEGLSGQ